MRSLRQPWVRRQALAGLLAQVTQGASGIGIILVVHQHTGSLPLAGGVVGALSIAAGIARPLQGRLIDRRGARGVIAATGLGHAAALAGIVGLAGLKAPGIALIIVGAAAGVTLPPVSTAMRVSWGQAAGSDDRTAAYSLVYLVQEIAILTGPLVLAVVIAAVDVSAAMLVIAAITSVGALGFGSPPDAGASAAAAGRARPSMPALHVIRARPVQMLVGIAFFLGGTIGGLEVAAPALALVHHRPAASGLLIAALSIGGIAGAALYASRRWTSTQTLRLIVLLAWVTVAIGFAGVADTLVAAGVLMLAAGLAINPALTTISVLIDRHIAGVAAAEAFGWLSTGLAGGTGAASAIAGAVTRHGGSARPAFAVAAIAAGCAAGAAAIALRRLRSA
jgi:predicted MFS family arabinose efflux permease